MFFLYRHILYLLWHIRAQTQELSVSQVLSFLRIVIAFPLESDLKLIYPRYSNIYLGQFWYKE